MSYLGAGNAISKRLEGPKFKIFQTPSCPRCICNFILYFPAFRSIFPVFHFLFYCISLPIFLYFLYFLGSNVTRGRYTFKSRRILNTFSTIRDHFYVLRGTRICCIFLLQLILSHLLLLFIKSYVC